MVEVLGTLLSGSSAAPGCQITDYRDTANWFVENHFFTKVTVDKASKTKVMSLNFRPVKDSSSSI